MTTSSILDLDDLRGDFTLEIVDVAGKLLRSRRTPSGVEGSALEAKRENLTSSQYLIRLSNGEESYELPFVVE